MALPHFFLIGLHMQARPLVVALEELVVVVVHFIREIFSWDYSSSKKSTTYALTMRMAARRTALNAKIQSKK